MMIELRVASGLHRGATLPLEGNTFLIGASEDADVVLVDPGIVSHHAKLSQTDGGWMLSTEEGVVRDGESNQAKTLIDLNPGDFARVGDVWLTLAHEDTPWVNPPATPQDEESTVFFSESSEMTAGDLPIDIENQPESEAPALLAVAEENNVVAASVAMPPNTAWRRRILRPIIAFPLLGLAVISAAYAISLPFTNTGEPATVVPLKENDKKTVSSNLPISATTPAATISQEALRTALRSRLSQAELLRYVDLTLEDQAWTIQAALDDEDAARFERILRAFLKEYHISFPVNVKVVAAEAMLPFKIMTVTTGANASMVTADGQRLYVGDQYKGITMLAINDTSLVFSGKRKIVVNR